MIPLVPWVGAPIHAFKFLVGCDKPVLFDAESVYLPREMLDRKFREASEVMIRYGTSDAAMRDQVVEADSWGQFLKEHPWVTGEVNAWRDRLVRVLVPTYATCEQPALSKVDVPEWRTSDVLGLAHAIDDRDVYDRLPVLADALEEAGCDDGDVLDHCRAGHPHGRNCWVTAWLLRSRDAGEAVARLA